MNDEDLSCPISSFFNTQEKSRKSAATETGKRALIKVASTATKFPTLSLPSARDHAAKPKSLPIAAKRDGGGVGLPNTGSPRKTLAFERWMQQEITAYQRRISSDGSRPNSAARLAANFLIKLTVPLAQKPCTSNHKNRTDASDGGFDYRKSDDPCFWRGLCVLLARQLCVRLGSIPRQRTRHGFPASGRSSHRL